MHEGSQLIRLLLVSEYPTLPLLTFDFRFELSAAYPHTHAVRHIDFAPHCARMLCTFSGAFSVGASTATKVIRETNFAGISPLARGKVRDIYDLGDKLLIVATDRLSAFDVVMPTPIPDKGRVLTQLSLFWFDKLRDVIPSHVLSATDFPAPFDQYADALAGRSMIVRKTQPLPIECVARGYLSGSGWKEYQSSGKVCGVQLPAGLKESDKLPEPIFTPATKAASGHDENIPFERAAEIIGKPLAEKVRSPPAGAGQIIDRHTVGTQKRGDGARRVTHKVNPGQA